MLSYILFPIASIVVIVLYYIIVKILKGKRISRIIVIAIPFSCNFIAANALVVISTALGVAYQLKMVQFRPKVSLVSQHMIESTGVVYWNFADYDYEINVQNTTNHDFKDMPPIAIQLGFFDETDTNLISPNGKIEINNFGLGDSIMQVDLQPGDNILKGKMLLSTNQLFCKNFDFKKKITVRYSYNLSGKSYLLDPGPEINDKILSIYQHLLQRSKTEPGLLPTCD